MSARKPFIARPAFFFLLFTFLVQERVLNAEGEATSTADPNAPASRATAILPPAINLPPQLAEIVRLAESGMSDEVIIAYIQRAELPYVVSADQVVYLRDLGISSRVLAALLEHRPLGPAAESEPFQPSSSAAMELAAAPPPLEPSPVEQPEPGPNDYTYFQDSLAPYGTWLDIPGYGWCWQPTVQVVNPTWQPYSDEGGWLWSDAGWYWNSYYSWGWAPFHYGRWCHYQRYGWIWRPDCAWGPAWVCWRQSTENCGWAPLPPGARYKHGVGWTFHGKPVDRNCNFGLAASSYTFVGYNHFADRHPIDHRLGRQEGTEAFNRSTVNNNLTVGTNRRVFNRGVDVQRVSTARQAPVRQVQVQDLIARQNQMKARGAWGIAAESVGQSPASVGRPYSGANYQNPRDVPGRSLQGVNSGGYRPGYRPIYPGSAPSAPLAPRAPSAPPALSGPSARPGPSALPSPSVPSAPSAPSAPSGNVPRSQPYAPVTAPSSSRRAG